MLRLSTVVKVAWIFIVCICYRWTMIDQILGETLRCVVLVSPSEIPDNQLKSIYGVLTHLHFGRLYAYTDTYLCWFRKSFLIMARTIKSLRNPHEVPINNDCLWPPSPFWRTPRSFPSFLDQRFWQTDSSRQASVALTCEFHIQTLRDKHLFIIPTSFI
jgi:hypothetical protein